MSHFSSNRIFNLDAKNKIRIIVTTIFILAIAAAFFVYPLFWDKAVDKANTFSPIRIPYFIKVPFKLGLDLAGGTHLVYRADVSNIASDEISSAMDGLKDTIERRVNLFGVSEPLVEVDKSGSEWRLIVELAGVKDIGLAIKMIGETPYLEFREERQESETKQILNEQKAGNQEYLFTDPYFKPTLLTGKFVQRAQVDFDPNTYQPVVNLEFNDEGSSAFSEITKRNINRRLAIYLDGIRRSAPVVQQEITGGKAVISGRFTIDEAKRLAQALNAGALPVPIQLISQDSVGASLGQDSLQKSIFAGLIGFLAVALFMIIFYRLPGLIAVLALLIYTALVLSIFKLIPVTLTLAGVAGFILSVGMAVDANILIFERLKEEVKRGKALGAAIDDGFKRAWPSIRDSNISTLITTAVLYFFTTSVVKGFALTLGIGVLVSMFSAIFVTRSLLKLFSIEWLESWPWFLGVKALKQENLI